MISKPTQAGATKIRIIPTSTHFDWLPGAAGVELRFPDYLHISSSYHRMVCNLAHHIHTY